MTSKHLKLAMQIDKLQRELEESPNNLNIINALDKLGHDLKHVNTNFLIQLSNLKIKLNE